jgi:hypothetical protein
VSDLIKATWVGPSGYEAPGGVVLIPGETVMEITAGEAVESGHWEPVNERAKPVVEAKKAIEAQAEEPVAPEDTTTTPEGES